MSAELLVWLGGAIAVGTALAGWPVAADTAPRRWPSMVGLGGLIVGLLLVGVVSGTIVRHVVQVAPAALALALVARHASSGRAAALPILIFWMVVMLTIWRYLLGMTRIIGGHFTTTEILLTVAIALACAIGLAGGARPTANLAPSRRALAAFAFGLLQFAAMWVSALPSVSGR
jgi:hypothetical protein